MKLTPRSEALAFRIWALCEPRGWGMTLKDCAEELGVDWNRVNGVARWKGWGNRFKAESSRDAVMAVHVSRGGLGWMPTGADVRDVIKSAAGIRHHGDSE